MQLYPCYFPIEMFCFLHSYGYECSLSIVTFDKTRRFVIIWIVVHAILLMSISFILIIVRMFFTILSYKYFLGSVPVTLLRLFLTV